MIEARNQNSASGLRLEDPHSVSNQALASGKCELRANSRMRSNPRAHRPNVVILRLRIGHNSCESVLPILVIEITFFGATVQLSIKN